MVTIETESERLASTAVFSSGPRSARRAELSAYSHRLQSLGRRFEDFLHEQFQRLRGILEHCERAGGSQSGSKSEASLKLTGNPQHPDDLRWIEEERNRLIEAWSRLEVEQRKLLAQREAWERQQAVRPKPDRSATGASAQDQAVSRPAPVSEPEVFQAHRPQPGDSDSTDEPRRQSMVGQFQRLRQDVRKHARRRKSKDR